MSIAFAKSLMHKDYQVTNVKAHQNSQSYMRAIIRSSDRRRKEHKADYFD